MVGWGGVGWVRVRIVRTVRTVRTVLRNYLVDQVKHRIRHVALDLVEDQRFEVLQASVKQRRERVVLHVVCEVRSRR